MKDNFEILNNVEMDLDKYEDLNIDKDKLKKKMRGQIKSKSKLKKNITKVAGIFIVGGGLVVAGIINPSLANKIPVIENIFEDLNETFGFDTVDSRYAQGIGQTQTKNGAGIINPSLANKIPVIENIFEDLNETFGFDTVDSRYAQGIGQTQTKNGVTVSIEEAVSDGHNLYLTYKIKSEEKLPRYDEYRPYGRNSGEFAIYSDTVSIEEAVSDGHNLYLTYKIKSEEKLPRYDEYRPYGRNSGEFAIYSDIKIDKDGSWVTGTGLTGYYKDEYTFVGMESYQLEFKGKEAPSNFNVKIKINHIGGVFANIEEMIKGPFKFSLNIDSKVDKEVIAVNKSQDGYKVRTIEVSPYGINVNVEFPKDYVSDRDDILKEVNLYDDKGKQVASHGYSYDIIKSNETRVENNTVYDTILFNYKENNCNSKPDYLILKFEDFYQSQEHKK